KDFANGVPHSEQNFAAAGLSAAQLAHAFSKSAGCDGGVGTAIVGPAAPRRRKLASAMAASAAAHPRGRDPAGRVPCCSAPTLGAAACVSPGQSGPASGVAGASGDAVRSAVSESGLLNAPTGF